MAKLYTLQEVADLLTLSVKTIRTYIQNGTLSAVRLGPRQLRVPESALNQFLERSFKQNEARS